jgi:pimeloyl-ACP methyl ester carboxylesterase
MSRGPGIAAADALGAGETEMPERVEGVRLGDGYARCVYRFGEGGEALVGLHGCAGASQRALLPLAQVADEWLQVVLYDRLERGFAAGSPEGVREPLERSVAEFEELVGALELGTVHLLGQGGGAVLALECALAWPELVESLLLCDFDPAEGPPGWRVDERLRELQLPAFVAHGAEEGADAVPSRALVTGLDDARWLILGQSGRSSLHGPEADVVLPAIRSFVLRAAV